MSLDAATTLARLTDHLWASRTDGGPDIGRRISAILGLETLAEAAVALDQGRLHIRIMEQLLAYLRQESPASGAPARPAEALPGWTFDLPQPRDDVQWALTVIARRSAPQRAAEAALPLTYTPAAMIVDPRLPGPDGDDGQPAGFSFGGGWQPDLRGINLQRADLTGAWLAGATLDDVPMEGARLAESTLTRASMAGTRLAGAHLRDARLARALLIETDLTGASLMAADLKGASLSEVALEGADLTGADLRGARFDETDLGLADLTGARR